MTFERTMLWSAVQAMVRLITGLLTIKLLAQTFGPQGVGLMAQLGTVISILGGLLANGAATAFIRLHADTAGLKEERIQLVNSMFWVFFLSVLIALVLWPFGSQISLLLLGNSGFRLAISMALVSVPLFVGGALLQAWLTSEHQARSIYVGQIVSNLFASALLIAAIFMGNLELVLAASAAAYGIPALWFWFFRDRDAVRFSKVLPSQFGKVAQYYPMLIVHSMALPSALLYLRWMSSRDQGIEWMGAWQAAWRLSEIYVTVVLGAASNYFSPRLAQHRLNPKEFRATVSRLILCTLIPIAGTGLIIFIFKAQLVPLIFSKGFSVTEQVLPVQLATDILRTLHWSIGLVLVTLMARRSYIALEVCFFIVAIALSWMIKPWTSNVAGWSIFLALVVSCCFGAVMLGAHFKNSRRTV